MTRNFKITLHILLIVMLCSGAYAQYKPGKERGDPKYRATAQMEGNQVRTTVFNFGMTGRENGNFPINVQTPYEWPKNTGKVYLAMEGLWAGGEVKDQSDSTIKIIDVFDFRTSKQGKTWNIEPYPGYYGTKKQEIATSSDPDTWPASWPDKMQDETDPGWVGKWNGYFGKNIFNADEEMFYRAGDDRYDRYNYIPDTTDVSRRGLGLTFEVRAMAWSQILVEDVVYLLHYIKNDGTKDINRVAATIWYADFVGGDGDSQDDISEFDLLEDIAWSHDKDNRAPLFGNDPVGAIAVNFLETPGNAVDRIDNDGDGEKNGPKVTEAMLVGEDPENQIDDNGNGLIDENEADVAFGTQVGVTYADGIDNNDNGEEGSPKVTQQMVDQSAGDKWKRWPPYPEADTLQKGQIQLIMVEADDIGHAFKDNIDNNGNGEEGSPTITQAIIDQAAKDTYKRYRVPGTKIILYNVTQDDLGKKYADGIDNDGNGAIDENIDEGIDEMIDESRNDGIDNDGDWNPLTDDVGLDGVPNTGDYGEGDGKPTSGARFGLPGEPHIDVTDVSETDQIGITDAQYVPAGDVNVNTNSDNELWFRFMKPGRFYDPTLVKPGEYDLFVSSSFFPLKAGQTEPISLAIILANGPIQDPGSAIRKSEILKKRLRAQETYNNDYKFANAPVTPVLTAIPGNNKVTLYWDSKAEQSFDQYIQNIGGDGHDFEGYRIYRSSDPAFEDVTVITNNQGVPKFKLPLQQYDLIDGIVGDDSTGNEGVRFYMGDDSGLQHSFVDSTVKNGFTYYYAITSYDKGYPIGKILPAECPIRISVQSDGTTKYGTNVVKIVPEAPSAGYVAPTLGNINLIQGSTTGKVGYDIVDINKIKDGHVYYLTFEDTLKLGSATKPDTLTTKNFTLTDSTTNEILINRSPNLASDYEQPLIDGFKLNFENESRVELDPTRSYWNNSNIKAYTFTKFTDPNPNNSGKEKPNDYTIIFSDVAIDTSITVTVEGSIFNGQPVNYKVYNRSTKSFIKTGFVELNLTGGAGKLTSDIKKQDRIVFFEPNAQDSLVKTWTFFLAKDTSSATRFPTLGDTITINLKKPFLSSDKFRFVAAAGKIDAGQAKKDLDNIKVVPNPYVASATWEPKNPYVSGRGPRSIHFTHLPNKCTIRIFTVSGELVSTIEHDSPYSDGTAYWDLLTKDKLSVAYGVYIYHVDAPGIGEKVGKFAVIK